MLNVKSEHPIVLFPYQVRFDSHRIIAHSNEHTNKINYYLALTISFFTFRMSHCEYLLSDISRHCRLASYKFQSSEQLPYNYQMVVEVRALLE